MLLREKKQVIYYTYSVIPFIYYKRIYIFIHKHKIYIPTLVQNGTHRERDKEEETGWIKRNFNI